jgi:hypothetical protein
MLSNRRSVVLACALGLALGLVSSSAGVAQGPGGGDAGSWTVRGFGAWVEPTDDSFAFGRPIEPPQVPELGGELARDRGGLRLERAGVVGAEELDVQGGVDDERDHHDRAGRQQDLAPDRSEQVRNPIDTSSPPARSAAETTGL